MGETESTRRENESGEERKKRLLADSLRHASQRDSEPMERRSKKWADKTEPEEKRREKEFYVKKVRDCKRSRLRTRVKRKTDKDNH